MHRTRPSRSGETLARDTVRASFSALVYTCILGPRRVKQNGTVRVATAVWPLWQKGNAYVGVMACVPH